jgi:nicotinate-nucleotide adenylyltransferase
MALLGFYGGTFDPIHQGHLQLALFVQQCCHLDRLELIPCHLPPHRAHPGVSSAHRAEMVRLAIAPFAQLGLNLLELEKNSPSYTIETLEILHRAHPHDQLLFVIGMDSLTQFHRWHRYQEILKLCHLVVCQRPGYHIDSVETKTLLAQHQRFSTSELIEQSAGGIFILQNPLFDISATAIRQSLQHSNPDRNSLSVLEKQSNSALLANQLQIPAVQAYIRTHQLYQV